MPYCNCGNVGCSNPDPNIERELKKLNPSVLLAVGDIVMLKSGGPGMTVVKVENQGTVPAAHAAWFLDDGTLQLAAFHALSLRKVNLDETLAS